MALIYEIDPRAQRVRVIYRDHPTFEAWANTMRTIFADPAFQPGYDFLFDKREVTAAEARYVEAAALFYQEHQNKMGRWAIVVTGLLAFGMTRMTASLCAQEDYVRAFTDLAEAEQWLTKERQPKRGAA